MAPVQFSSRWLGKRACGVAAGALFVAVMAAGCSVELPNPIPFGTSFITKGTFELQTPFGAASACPVWVDTSGAVYQLFQGEDVSNAEFDQVTTPGVTSRLQLKTRDDLIVGCKVGTTVQVEAVREIVP